MLLLCWLRPAYNPVFSMFFSILSPKPSNCMWVGEEDSVVLVDCSVIHQPSIWYAKFRRYQSRELVHGP